ncbi:MAG: hypothetical protein JXB49_28445 [Bacteroidales bacterium]|nr:hypothetical protein [Bacteroidales bacterium]
MIQLVLISISVLLVWNSNKVENKDPTSIIEVTINNNEDYELGLMISGDEEWAAIITRLLHYQVSELIRNENTGWSIV